jgi:hypothetical protein
MALEFSFPLRQWDARAQKAELLCRDNKLRRRPSEAARARPSLCRSRTNAAMERKVFEA